MYVCLVSAEPVSSTVIGIIIGVICTVLIIIAGVIIIFFVRYYFATVLNTDMVCTCETQERHFLWLLLCYSTTLRRYWTKGTTQE